METIEQIRSLHDRVLNNMFRLLVDFDVLSQAASSCPTRLPLYALSDQQKFFFFEMESEVTPYVNTITRLLETDFMRIVSEPSGNFLFFVKTKDYEAMTEEEKEDFFCIPELNFIEIFKRGKSFSFLDEIL